MELITYLEKAFFRANNPSNATQMSAYMRNKFPFLGIKKPDRAALQKEIFSRYVVNSEGELIALLCSLWDKSEREYQMAACDLAYRYRKLWTPKFLETIDQLIRTKSWWDSVDTLSSKILGALIKQFPELQVHMDIWIQDQNMWIRRAALIHQLSFKKETDDQRLFSYCSATLHEKEFFIRKAIGWALRQHSRTDPQAVRNYLIINEKSLSPLSYKEASKYC